MVKRKRQHPDIEEVLERPWCYYCERDFDDLKILISHQKAKHYKCDQCGRRLNTAGGLSVHMSQVHKESLTSIENALPNRNDVNIEIFGMEGVPADVLEAHRQRITNEYFKRMAARRAETGNPPPGAAQATQTKRVKAESGEELRKRLAEHKARREAQKSGKLDPASHSGANTPNLLDSLMPDPSESKDYVVSHSLPTNIPVACARAIADLGLHTVRRGFFGSRNPNAADLFAIRWHAFGRWLPSVRDARWRRLSRVHATAHGDAI